MSDRFRQVSLYKEFVLLTIRVPSSITPGMNFGDDKMCSIIEGRMSEPPCTPSRSFRISTLSSILALLNRVLSMTGKVIVKQFIQKEITVWYYTVIPCPFACLFKGDGNLDD